MGEGFAGASRIIYCFFSLQIGKSPYFRLGILSKNRKVACIQISDLRRNDMVPYSKEEMLYYKTILFSLSISAQNRSAQRCLRSHLHRSETVSFNLVIRTPPQKSQLPQKACFGLGKFCGEAVISKSLLSMTLVTLSQINLVIWGFLPKCHSLNSQGPHKYILM